MKSEIDALYHDRELNSIVAMCYHKAMMPPIEDTGHSTFCMLAEMSQEK